VATDRRALIRLMKITPVNLVTGGILAAIPTIIAYVDKTTVGINHTNVLSVVLTILRVFRWKTGSGPVRPNGGFIQITQSILTQDRDSGCNSHNRCGYDQNNCEYLNMH